MFMDSMTICGHRSGLECYKDRAPTELMKIIIEVNPSSSLDRSVTAADYLEQIQTQLGDAWLPRIYSGRILKMRTRAYEFPAIPKNASPGIQHTLLGIELKVGRRRMLCPDLATARYLAVFARIGCPAVAIPYDITRVSHAADELESSWHRMLLLADSLAAERSSTFRARLRRLIIGKVRDEIDEGGAGERIPEFNTNTKQYRRNLI